METIAAAVVSAAASVAVALINRPREEKGRADHGPTTSAATVPWVVAVACLAAVTAIAFGLTAEPRVLIAVSLAAVPLAAILAAYLLAPGVRAAASGVFAIHAINAGVMSISDIPGFTIAGSSDLLLLLALFGVNAGLAAAAARVSPRRPAVAGSRSEPKPADGDGPPPALAGELARLAQLRKEGMLTDDEYSAAKRKLLE